MVKATNNGIVHYFECENWALLDPNSGWVAIESNCTEQYWNRERTPFANYDFPKFDGDKYYLFLQQTPSNLWTIHHNLNKFAAVTLTDSAGNEVECDVQHLNTNQLILKMKGQFAGRAFCN